MRPVVGVGALILGPDGRLLIGHRIKPDEPPSWCLPGGHVEAGESFEGAAAREVSEETGITGLEDVRCVGVALNVGTDRPHVTGAVIAHCGVDADPAVLEPEVFDQWTWADPADPPAPLFPASAALLDLWRSLLPEPGWVFYPTEQK